MRKTNLTRICKQCQREFKVLPSEIKKKKGIFCSMCCRAKYYTNVRLSSFFIKKDNVPWNKGKVGVQKGWNKGLKCPQIGIKLIGNKNGRGSKQSEENKNKLRLLRLGKQLSLETKLKISKALIGKKQSTELRLKKSVRMSGKNNPFYKDGKSKERKSERQIEMRGIRYRMWRESVFKRDDYTCCICSERGKKLNADHIKTWKNHPDERYNVDNGRTLCIDCHRNIHKLTENKTKANLNDKS